jgi:hypothetical protein
MERTHLCALRFLCGEDLAIAVQQEKLTTEANLPAVSFAEARSISCERFSAC